MSAGAKFIWNTRFFHIAKDGEKLSDYAVSSDYVKNLVEYVGTRESVALNIDEKYINDPATEKQKDLIQQLCRLVPDYKDSFEYEDYEKAQTKGNASELIAYLSEQVELNGAFNEVANLVEYVAKRPGAVKVGEHGLFSSEDNIDLKKVQDEMSSHKGNIWTHVLSIRREDADRLGYDSQKPWKDLVKANLDIIAEVHQIKPANLRWYSAMHNTGYHPHIHLFVYSVDPTEGYFNNKNTKNNERNKLFQKCKRAFATKIFAEDMHNAYVAKDSIIKDLKNETQVILDRLLDNPLNYDEKSKNSLINKFIELSEIIPANKEVYYGYLSADKKKLVNDILCGLVYDNEELSELYKKWCEQQVDIERIYIKEPNVIPIEKNKDKNFTAIKNKIIKAAQNISKQTFTKENNILNTAKSSVADDFEREQPDADNILDNNANETFDIAETELIIESIDSDFSKLYAAATNPNLIPLRTGDICFELANCFMYGKDVQRDPGEAMTWYGIAADQYKHTLAAYRLGQLYTYGADGIDTNPDMGSYYFKTAHFGMRYEIKNQSYFNALEEDKDNLYYSDKVSISDAYKEYLLGCMYLKGEGVEQNYSNAYYAFKLAANNKYNHAYYNVGNLLYYGLGIKQDYKKAFEYFEKASSNGKNPYADYRIAKMYLNGEGVDVNIEKAEQYLLKAKENIISANYDLAKLYENNNDTFNKTDKDIFSLYKTALDGFVKQDENKPNASNENRIASMYMYGKGTDVDINESVKWFEKAAKQGNIDSCYQLGRIYSSEKYGITDIKKSDEYYKTALNGYIQAEKENTNATIQYRIGLMYYNGLGTEKDIEKAGDWFLKSMKNENASAAYMLANIFENENTELSDRKKAISCYQIAAELGNAFADYKLGNINLKNGDIEEAKKSFKKASDNNVAHASYKLGQIYFEEKSDNTVSGKSQTNSQSEQYYAKALQQYISDYRDKPADFTAYRIASMYMYGQGTDIDINESVKWFEKSAAWDNPDAYYQLGHIYSNDSNLIDKEKAEKNYQKAFKLFNEAFNLKFDNYSSYKIGTMYNYGLGVERSIEKAIEWYKKSLELGNDKAQSAINNAEQQQSASLMSIATTACHIGKVIDAKTNNMLKQRYSSDSKVLRQEKIKKIKSGHAVDETPQSYDY